MARYGQRKTPKTKSPLEHDGALCVLFANAGLAKRPPIDTYDDLLTWGRRAEVLTDAAVRRLRKAAERRPEDADAAVRRAGAVRANLERVLRAVAQGRHPAADDVAALNAELGAVLAQRRLVPLEGVLRFAWTLDDDGLDSVLGPVLLSASEVLVSAKCHRLGECDDPECRLLYLDHVAGRRRRWCSRACGHRFHAREHYQTTVKPMRRKAAKKAKEEGRAFWRRFVQVDGVAVDDHPALSQLGVGVERVGDEADDLDLDDDLDDLDDGLDDLDDDLDGPEF